MKHIRIWFTKTGAAKYISHLDLNRCMARAIHKAKIPLWYTEGFNPHAFLTFALPLSLGMEGKRESMDIKMEGDLEKDEIMQKLNEALPPDIRIFDVTEPVNKPGKIAYASFLITLEPEEESCQEVLEEFHALLAQPEIRVEKKTKSGVKEIDLKPFCGRMESRVQGNLVVLEAILPAGSTENINPGLLLDAFRARREKDDYTTIVRTGLYDDQMRPFA